MNKAAFWALMAALCFGVAPVFEKLGLRQANPMAAIFVRALLTTVCTGFYIFSDQGAGQLASWSFFTWVAIIASGFFGVLLAQVFYFQALKWGEVGRVVPIAGSYPLFAGFLAAILLGEKLTPGRMFGTVLVFLGVLLLS